MLEAVRQSVFLAVEGLDEKNFFESLLDHMGIPAVEIEDVGGVMQFSRKMPVLLRRTGFRDNEGFIPPSRPGVFTDGMPRIGIFIMPGSGEQGMLEDLCSRTVQGHAAIPCVDGFIRCARNAGIDLAHEAKARAQAFLTVMPEIVSRVGEGAKKGYWNFEDAAMTDVRQFVERLRL